MTGTSGDVDEDALEAEPRSPMLSLQYRHRVPQQHHGHGSYHRFNIYQLEENGVLTPKRHRVPGGQGDISIVDHLLIMSVEETRGQVDCGCRAYNKISEQRLRIAHF